MHKVGEDGEDLGSMRPAYLIMVVQCPMDVVNVRLKGSVEALLCEGVDPSSDHGTPVAGCLLALPRITSPNEAMKSGSTPFDLCFRRG